MEHISTDLLLSMPEIFVLSMACITLVLELFALDRGYSIAYGFAQATLIVAVIITITTTYMFPGETLAYSSTYISDPMSALAKVFVFVVTFFGFVYSRTYLKDRDIYKGEFYVLGLFGVLGMMIMISAHNMLIVYLGLELMSLSMYALVALHRESRTASEAAMKYFVLGALASGLLLYGMSMIYGITGSLDIAKIAMAIAAEDTNIFVLSFGLSFLVVGLAFKFGAVPFHMWVPDVYHGAPTPVTLYISTAPKIAAFVMAMRLLVDGLSSLHEHWEAMLIVLAVLSIGLGNLVAIAQTNIKRMLAYSTISHMGFLLLGLLAGTTDGYAAAMFYAITYAFTAAAAFGVLMLISRRGFDAQELTDLRGLNQRSPWFAFMMMIIMFSLAGVPPLVGFYAKLAVLSAIVDLGYFGIAISAVVFSVIGAYYYLRVLKIMYFEEPDEDAVPIQQPMDMKLALSLNSIMILVLGLFPGTLLAICASVML